MPLFRRIQRAESGASPVGEVGAAAHAVRRALTPARLDPAEGDPDLACLLRTAKERDWPAARAVLESVPSGEERDWLLRGLVEYPGSEAWLAAAVTADPGDDLARLALGARHIAWAWEARGGARAVHVSREAFQVFFARLRAGESLLYAVAERRPDWSAPWYFLQIAGRGLEVGAQAAAFRFEAAVRRVPGHLGAHRERLQQVCAKWGGSHEEAHAFARAAMLAHPPGGPLGELVAAAHLEEGLNRGVMIEHMVGPHVIAALHEAADHSVRHPAYTGRRDRARTLNTFAMAFSLAGERPAAREMFAAIGPTATTVPWRYLSVDPLSAFNVWR